jgi:UDP-galactopyranose mutase
MLNAYIDLARNSSGISFLGRLGTYRYLDMDVTIAEALNACDQIDNALRVNATLPTFFIDPS